MKMNNNKIYYINNNDSIQKHKHFERSKYVSSNQNEYSWFILNLTRGKLNIIDPTMGRLMELHKSLCLNRFYAKKKKEE